MRSVSNSCRAMNRSRLTRQKTSLGIETGDAACGAGRDLAGGVGERQPAVIVQAAGFDASVGVEHRLFAAGAFHHRAGALNARERHPRPEQAEVLAIARPSGRQHATVAVAARQVVLAKRSTRSGIGIGLITAGSAAL